ncbi:MAG: restriction endonuclease subunit S [Parvibaculum sp.]|nr:restriction endonuclease subunit S [Parvibaculum sp.]
MNAERLLQHYERIADAPEAIARLRRFILDLAVRGKLVPQDANDEPASELLKQIAKEKARLVKAGEARKLEVDPVALGDHPFALPSAWAWTRLGAIGDWGSGSTPPRGASGLYGGNVTWLKSGELNDNRALAGSEETVTEVAIAKGSFRINKPGDVLIAMYGATIGKVAILAESAVTNQAVCGCTPFAGVFNQFLFLFLLSQREQFHSASEGGAQPNISKVKIVWTPFPLPPLAEQQRIVAKVDELMGLCDRLEAARAGREAVRDRLTAASLARLNAPNPETFEADARFALDALPALTTRPDQIRLLRQTIFNLAVRGKLVPQEADDEPASELLKQIAKEKARLVKAGEIRKPRDLDGGDDLNEPFPVPPTWRWVRLDAVGAIVGGGTPPAADPGNFTEPGEGIPWLTPADLGGYSDLYISRGSRDLTEKGSRASSATVMPKGTVLFTSRAPIGYVAIAANPISTNQGFKSIVPYILDCSHFIATAMKAFAPEIDAKAPGTTFKEVSGKIVAGISFPLPPLAEQHRIVAKVDELMGLCDRLEASLDQTAATRRRLLDALLAEALTPAEARGLEAAE